MSTEHAPSTLAEAVAAETGEQPEAYEVEGVELRSLDAAEADEETVDLTSDEHAAEFDEHDLEDAVEIRR